jgi:hypothetical protein
MELLSQEKPKPSEPSVVEITKEKEQKKPTFTIEEIRKLARTESKEPFASKQQEIHRIAEEFRKDDPEIEKLPPEEAKKKQEERYQNTLKKIQGVLER